MRMTRSKRPFARPALTFPSKVKQRRQLLPVWQPRSFHAQLVKELMNQRLGCTAASVPASADCHHKTRRAANSRQTGCRGVLEQVADESDSVCRCTRPEDLCEWVRLDLREFVLHVLMTSVKRTKAWAKL